MDTAEYDARLAAATWELSEAMQAHQQLVDQLYGGAGASQPKVADARHLAIAAAAARVEKAFERLDELRIMIRTP